MPNTFATSATEPLIDHLDNNPFGVKVDLKATLSQYESPNPTLLNTSLGGDFFSGNLQEI